MAQLVRQRIPDREGNTLPVDVSSVTYDLQDLTQRSHSLTVGELAVGGTWGVQAVQPPCPECCGQDVLGFSPDPVDLATGNTDTVAIDGVEACNGDPTVLTPDFTSWGSGNSSIASVSYAKVKGLAVGSTTGYANGLVQVPGACACNFVPAETYVPIFVQVPAGEITEFNGTYQISAGQFLMTLEPSSNNYDGNTVTESSPVIGVNSCWWSGSNMEQYPTVEGSTWTVGQGSAGHNQYGLDTVGYGSGVVNLIQTQGAAHGVEFPCTIDIYQSMNYENVDLYVTNLLTQTVGSNTVNVCRAGVCSGTIHY